MMVKTSRGWGRTGRNVASLSLAGVALWAMPLEAQTVQAPASPAADTLSDAATPDQGDLVVVARRRDEHIQSVPIPITVITSQELARQNLVNFTNFQTKFPSFSVYLTNPKQLNLGIRGIGNNGFNTDGIDASVGVFVDGV